MTKGMGLAAIVHAILSQRTGGVNELPLANLALPHSSPAPAKPDDRFVSRRQAIEGVLRTQTQPRKAS